MDDLNAQQIVLLTLLVSFVTSIATGITTVALLEQAPDPVSQTINRVVEKTIERVISEPTDNTETVIEKEVITIVVNEEDLTIEAIEKNSKSIVRVFSQNEAGRNFLKLGLVINSEGDFVTDASQILEGVEYIGVYETEEFPISLERKNPTSNFAVMSINSTEEKPNPNNFRTASLANSNSLKIGQSVISLSGENRNSVSTGIINRFDVDDDSENVDKIKTSVLESNVLPGSVVINLQGEIIGMKIGSESLEKTSFIPSNMIKSFLAEKEQENPESN